MKIHTNTLNTPTNNATSQQGVLLQKMGVNREMWDKEQKEVEAQFASLENIFTPEEKKMWQHMQCAMANKTTPKIDAKIVQNINENKENTIGTLNIKEKSKISVVLFDAIGSSKLENKAINEVLPKMFAAARLLEKIFTQQQLYLFSSRGDELDFCIANPKSALNDLAIVSFVVQLFKKMQIPMHIMCDKVELSPVSVYQFNTKASSLKTLLDQNLNFFYKKLDAQKWGVNHYIGEEFLQTLRQENKSSESLVTNTRQKISSLLNNKEKYREKPLIGKQVEALLQKEDTNTGTEHKEALANYGLLAKKLEEIAKNNHLSMQSVFAKRIISDDSAIIEARQKNESIFLVKGETEVQPVTGQIVKLSKHALLGEGSLLGQGGVANAKCVAKKGSEIVEIPHDFLHALLDSKKTFGGQKINCLQEDREAIKKTFKQTS